MKPSPERIGASKNQEPQLQYPKRPHKQEDPTTHDFWYPLMLGLGTRMSGPYVYAVFWAPNS